LGRKKDYTSILTELFEKGNKNLPTAWYLSLYLLLEPRVWGNKRSVGK
jgi:hypothetical protein